MTENSDNTLDQLAEIFESISEDRHLQFLNIDPGEITPDEIQFDRSGRLRAWTLLEKVVCSLGDLRSHKHGLAFVGMLGHFTSGKSSMINAIVGDSGQRMADRNPTDKTITLICHPKNIAQLRENSFTSIDGISIDAGPSIELLKNIVLVDTPGLGNEAAEHDMAERFLHLCHVIIVAIDGRVPLADTAGNLALLDKAINKLGDVPKIFAVTKAVEFLSDRRGDFDTDWDQAAADKFWTGVKSRMTSDSRFVGASKSIDDIPVVFVDSIDGYNISTLIDMFVPIIQDESQRPRTYDAQVKYVVQIALEAMKVFNAYLNERLENLSSLHSQAKTKADEAKSMLSRRQDSVLNAIVTATAKIDELQQSDDISQRLLPVPEPSELLLRDRYGEFHTAINNVENHLRDVERQATRSLRESAKRHTAGHFRLFFCTKKEFPTEDLLRQSKEIVSNLRSYDEHSLLIALTNYFEKAHHQIVYDIENRWSNRSLESSAKVITTAFTEAYQALAGGLGDFISSYNLAARTFVAYLMQPTQKKLLAEYGVVLFDDDEKLALEAAELTNSDFAAFGAADNVTKDIKSKLARIVEDETRELAHANIGDVSKQLATPSFEHSDLSGIYDNHDKGFHQEAGVFLSEVQANLATSKVQMGEARASCKDDVKDIWLGWLEFVVKIVVIWIVLYVTIVVVKKSDIQLYDWLYDTAATNWIMLSLSVIGALIVELLKFGFRRNNDFVSPSTFSFGLRSIYEFAKAKRRIEKAFCEYFDSAFGRLKQRLAENALEIGAQTHRVLGTKIDASVDGAGVTDLKEVLQKYRDERVSTYQQSRQLFINSTNTLRKELNTVSETKSTESVDRVLDRISDTQLEVTTFLGEMQRFEAQLEPAPINEVSVEPVSV